MNEINRVGLCASTNAIVDALELIENDVRGISGALNYNASSHGMAVKSLKALADEIRWLAMDIALSSRNGASYRNTYQTMGSYEYKIDCLYDIIDDVKSEYYRDEINDAIKKLAGLHAPLMKVMEGAVLKNWQISEANKARAEREDAERENIPW